MSQRIELRRPQVGAASTPPRAGRRAIVLWVAGPVLGLAAVAATPAPSMLARRNLEQSLSASQLEIAQLRSESERAGRWTPDDSARELAVERDLRRWFGSTRSALALRRELIAIARAFGITLIELSSRSDKLTGGAGATPVQAEVLGQVFEDEQAQAPVTPIEFDEISIGGTGSFARVLLFVGLAGSGPEPLSLESLEMQIKSRRVAFRATLRRWHESDSTAPVREVPAR